MSARYRKSYVKRETATKLFGKMQMVVLLMAAALLVVGLVFLPVLTLQVIISAILLFGVLYLGFKIVLHFASKRYVTKHFTASAIQPVSVDDPDLPTYTVFVPLYHEANMLNGLVENIGRLLYPQHLLQVLLLLEEDDDETRSEAIGMDLPECFEIVVIPNMKPRGKPKALNMGLAVAIGVLSVIYDAEDDPDPDQLLKVVAAFRAAPQDVAVFQARLNFWNEVSSWITRFYWTEYIVHFERILPGLAQLGLIPPLGGTSNHFRTEVLRRVAFSPEQLPQGAEGIGGWDPWNVTEDAELAGALAAHGYKIMMVDSVTQEEASSKAGVADKQRRRWLKGYLQTGLIYSRHPVERIRQMGFMRWFFYILMMMGTPVSLLLNPLTWGLTVAYFATRSTFIESLFPAPLFYTGIALIVIGNAFLFFQLVGACITHEGYGTLKYLLLAPVWWLFTSRSAYGVLWELARPSTRHQWNKTPHGQDTLLRAEKKKTAISQDRNEILDAV
jgi:cellulose synthase/poly-beta-1,6-N-acetylglucosamine synthase-like glycosyltransferase